MPPFASEIIIHDSGHTRNCYPKSLIVGKQQDQPIRKRKSGVFAVRCVSDKHTRDVMRTIAKTPLCRVLSLTRTSTIVHVAGNAIRVGNYARLPVVKTGASIARRNALASWIVVGKVNASANLVDAYNLIVNTMMFSRRIVLVRFHEDRLTILLLSTVKI